MGSQRNIPLGSMQVSQAAISSLGLLVILALGEAANINDGSLYHVVEDIQGNETQDSVGGDVPTCLDVMAQNGLNFSSFWHGAAHGLHSLHLEEIRPFFVNEFELSDICLRGSLGGGRTRIALNQGPRF